MINALGAARLMNNYEIKVGKFCKELVRKIQDCLQLTAPQQIKRKLATLISRVERQPLELGLLNSRLDQLVKNTPPQLNQGICEYMDSLSDQVRSDEIDPDPLLGRELTKLNNAIEGLASQEQKKDITFSQWLGGFSTKIKRIGPQKQALLNHLAALAKQNSRS